MKIETKKIEGSDVAEFKLSLSGPATAVITARLLKNDIEQYCKEHNIDYESTFGYIKVKPETDSEAVMFKLTFSGYF
jgi:hypothetical protein